MIGALRNRTLAIGVVAAVQLAALGYFVWERENRVRNGTDVVLEVIPVDPRSLFQGDYVVLGFPISTLSVWYGAEPKVGSTVFMTVVPGANGTWTFANWGYDGVSAQKAGGVTLKGKVDRVLKPAKPDGTENGEYRVVFGLERFFVPEGKGLGLEDLVRNKKLSAIVSVWRDGSSTLKGLVSEGKVLYETGVAAKRPEDVVPLAEQPWSPPETNDPGAPQTSAAPTEAIPVPAPDPQAPPVEQVAPPVETTSPQAPPPN